MKSNLQEHRDITKIPELLSPAGGPTELKAAVQAGADAVYLGLRKHNARQGAENFDFETLREAVHYCRIRGVSVYLTLNTLIDEDDFEETLVLGKKAWDIGVDAILVQDLGLARALHECGINIHASTQMTITSLEGAIAAKEMGFSRVVLARELSLDEIRYITENCGIETEVFCHGALCNCYSGQCEMSFMQGGRSGNRGSCAQPCRMAYRLDAGSRSDEYLYHLSPGDLCTLEILPKLLSTGVASLKIEGRLKNPEYVAVITSIYRKAIDTGVYDKDDLNKLALAFSRSTFTTGHMLGKMKSSSITLDYPARVGLHVGKALSNPRPSKKYGTVPTYTFKASLDKPLQPGDGISFGKENGGVVNVYFPETGMLTVAGEMPHSNIVSLPLYQTYSIKLDKEAKRLYENGENKKTFIDGRFVAHRGEPVSFEIWDGKTKITVTGDVPQEAEGGGISENDITHTLWTIGNTPYKFNKIDVLLDDKLFIPFSKIKDMRREAIDKLSEERSKRR